jgi:hypothetical protein
MIGFGLQYAYREDIEAQKHGHGIYFNILDKILWKPTIPSPYKK